LSESEVTEIARVGVVELEDLFNKMTSHLSVGRAFGVAYEKDDTLIIPVALVVGGGGGGGSDGPTIRASVRHFDIDDDEVDDDVEDDEDETFVGQPMGGSGGGFGGVVMPVGVYVVKDDRVRWVPAINVTLIAICAIALARVFTRPSGKSHHRHH
jgi:uncharacterized spore protein YtfJ